MRRKGLFLSTGAVLLFLGCALNVSGEDPPPNGPVAKPSRPSAADSSSRVAEKLTALDKEIDQKHLSFQVGNTEVLLKKVKAVAGFRLPANLSEIAASQALKAARLTAAEAPARVSFMIRQPKLGWSLSGVDGCTQLPNFDWRKLGKVSPVRDQGNCNACWAFATTSVLESSYMLREGKPIHASEQFLVDCSLRGDCKEGGFWAFDFLQVPRGDPDASKFPYEQARNLSTNCDSATDYSDVNWGFVNPSKAGDVPSVDEIKRALCTYGPIAAAMHASPLFLGYVYGVFDEKDPGPVNHGVTIVGWDDAVPTKDGPKGAWIIKNSYGPCWGDNVGYVDPSFDGSECAPDRQGKVRKANRGYAWVAYGSNSIGVSAAWAQAPLPDEPNNILSTHNLGGFYTLEYQPQPRPVVK